MSGRVWRLFLLAIVMIGLSPGTWWREPAKWRKTDDSTALTAIRLDAAARDLGGPRFVAAWQLDSTNRHFGGFSALLLRKKGRLLAISDRGRQMEFSFPDRGDCCAAFGFFAGVRITDKFLADIESATSDLGSGRIWVGYEGANRIERYDSGFTNRRGVHPSKMKGWGSNTGPESMVRLHDGRFIVLAEADPGLTWSTTPGLLFSGDPVEGTEPVEFRFLRPDDFRPVDMAELPDGRVLILMRKVLWGLPPGFESRVLIADPAQITPDGEWSGVKLFDITSPLPTENYEGLAIEPLEDGQVRLWLISDDNVSKFQRTLLLEFEWDPREKARN